MPMRYYCANNALKKGGLSGVFFGFIGAMLGLAITYSTSNEGHLSVPPEVPPIILGLIGLALGILTGTMRCQHQPPDPDVEIAAQAQQAAEGNARRLQIRQSIG